MKHIAIVGGSKGIGFEITKAFVDRHKVYNMSRSMPNFEHENLTHYTCDVTQNTLPVLDQVDTLIYCPGSINLKPITRLDIEDFKADLEINLFGAIKAIKTYLPQLKKSELNASILLFSSVATKLGMPFHASISAAKSAVEGLVKSLAAELAPNIRINAIAPTITNTNLANKLLRNEQIQTKTKERHPLKNYLDPEEVATLATYLTSDEAKAFSGQIFNMDYGIVSLKL
ncbi:SDR family NAD(P)-dependent oxidoreductase [Pontimicrobium sp. IMCC45349]|uniref:SDR family NAD(P)-dependent oxidoreductase n=1 Tax=Pontimicrobium sp. IMCC45349 TaxID=3391574 RepID=UPI00399F0CDE